MKNIFMNEKYTSKTTMQVKLWRIILLIAVPLIIVIIGTSSSGIIYALQYDSILNNVTTASDFNQDFKDDINLKMYYYVIDSQYSEGLPLEEVQTAEKIALKLIDTTTEKESLRAISSVLNLCHNLEDKMILISNTSGYESREEQLEQNIYVLTDLIQEYMYTYLYYESVHLNSLQTRMISNMIVFMGITMILSFVLIFFLLTYSRKLSRRVVDPIDEICERLEAIGKGSLLVCEPIQADVEEVQILSDGIENMVARLKRQIEKNAEQEKERRRTELALLQAQISPHFLYNTLDTIIWLIESGEIKGAVTIVCSLSSFFRVSLSGGQNIITLGEEEQHIRSYLEIQQMRYRDLMTYEINIPDDIKKCIIPKLTLQPLVENALYHGIKTTRRKGLIKVTGRADDENVILVVEDDGLGMTSKRLEEIRQSLESTKGEGFGLRTVHQRIQIFFGAEYGLTVESASDGGTKITVKIPMQNTDKETNT